MADIGNSSGGYQPVPGQQPPVYGGQQQQVYPQMGAQPGYPQQTGYQQPPMQGYQQPPVGYQQPPQGYQQPPMQQPGVQVTVIQAQTGGRGAGPYPGETCCGCFEIKCGMQVLAVLGCIGCVAYPFAFLQYLFHPWGSDGRILAFGLIGAALLLPQFYGGIILGKWLVNDKPETRALLPKAFMVYMISQVLQAFWQIVGSFICLGSLYPIYLLKTYPQYMNVSYSGYYPDISQLESSYTASFIASQLVGLVIGLALNYYYMGVAKRLIALW